MSKGLWGVLSSLQRLTGYSDYSQPGRFSAHTLASVPLATTSSARSIRSPLRTTLAIQGRIRTGLPCPSARNYPKSFSNFTEVWFPQVSTVPLNAKGLTPFVLNFFSTKALPTIPLHKTEHTTSLNTFRLSCCVLAGMHLPLSSQSKLVSQKQ